MIRDSVLSVLLAVASIHAFAAPAAGDPNASLSAFHAALARGDKATALSLLAPNVAIYESGFVEASRDDYAHHHVDGDIAFAKTSTRKVLRHSEKMAGNTAIIWEETETTGTSRGNPVHSFGTETALLEKTGAQWVITHVHWSSRKAK
ncbi:YybH family protein [Massilia sp. TWR1-2-2]|uniref:YybH family protein n=1 Tax=Massilia sp. TWR1-2-2 TaxID=2804584 RepID=UPI003CFAF402